MPTYKNTTNRHISHIDKYSGSKWVFAPGEEKVLDFYLDEPLEEGIVITSEAPYPNPITISQIVSGNTGDVIEVALSEEASDYYGDYTLSIVARSGSFDLSFNGQDVTPKTKIESGEVWSGRVHKKYIKKIFLSCLEDGAFAKVELYRNE